MPANSPIQFTLPALAGLKLSELISALSHALDITEGQPEGLCVRCCWIGMHIGRRLGLGDSMPWVLQFVLSHTGLRAPLAERFRSGMTIMRDGEQIATELIATRCHRGAEIAHLQRFPESVSAGIYSLDEHFNGQGKPRGVTAKDICLETRIITTADIFDAITAERLCRGAVPIPKTLEIMAENVGTAIDAKCFDALKQALARLPA